MLVVVDDVAAGYQAQAFTDLVDVDHVEVLNGPQSTLYGKSASAGLIAVTTKASSETFTYFGDVKVTNDNEQRATLSVSGPISDTVGFRLSGSYRHYGGNVENLYTNSKINTDETFSLHGKVEWKPTERFSATFAAHFSQDNAVCCGVPLTRLDQPTLATLFGASGPTLAVADPGVVPGPNNRSVSVDQPPLARSQDYGISTHLSYDFGDVSFTSITAINHYKMHDLTDYDTGSADIMKVFTPCGVAPNAKCNNQTTLGVDNGGTPSSITPATVHGGFLQGGKFNVQTFSQEFRLSSNGDGDFKWLVGTYFSGEDLVRVFQRGLLATCTVSGSTCTNFVSTAGMVANTKSDTSWRGETRYENYAIFGQASYLVLPKTTIIAGLRLNREHSAYSYDDYYRVVHFPASSYLGVNLPDQNIDDKMTGKLGAEYQFTDDIMAFATISKGYKGVAYDLVSNLTALEASTSRLSGMVRLVRLAIGSTRDNQARNFQGLRSRRAQHVV